MISFSKIKFLLLVIFLFIITYSYLGYRNVDPEGACKGCKNIGRCLEAWVEYSQEFRPLPSDDEMLEYFRNHRNTFEEMAKDAETVQSLIYTESRVNKYGSLDEVWFLKKYSNLLNIDLFRVLCHASHDEYPGQVKYYKGLPDSDDPGIPIAFTFPRVTSMYILGPEDFWPHNSHEKGYVYFRIAPRIENGFVIGPVRMDGSLQSWPLYNHLDNKWLKTMKRNDYKLRQIDANWFLYISKDNLSG